MVLGLEPGPPPGTSVLPLAEPSPQLSHPSLGLFYKTCLPFGTEDGVTGLYHVKKASGPASKLMVLLLPCPLTLAEEMVTFGLEIV